LEGMSEVDRKQRELYSKQQQMLREQRSQDMQKLLDCISGVPFRGIACLAGQDLLLVFLAVTYVHSCQSNFQGVLQGCAWSLSNGFSIFAILIFLFFILKAKRSGFVLYKNK
jgi:hypothetical protein